MRIVCSHQCIIAIRTIAINLLSFYKESGCLSQNWDKVCFFSKLRTIDKYYYYLCYQMMSKTSRLMSKNQQIVMNRIKVTLVEKQKTSRWLAEQMGKSENTISRWCSNKSQPSIAQLQEIAKWLDVDVRTLITPTKEQ